MKFKLFILITAIISLILLSGCENRDEDIPETDISGQVSELEETFAYGCTTKTFTDYMTKWAESLELDHSIDAYGNIIFTLPGTKAYEDVKDIIICCSYNPSDFYNDINNISICKFLIENTKDHGKLRIIFLNNENDNQKGALNISTQYFPKDSQVIVLDSSYKTHASLNTGNQTKMSLEIPVSKCDNLYNTAYKISITGIKAGSFDEKVNSHPNPIKILGELMAYLKMKSVAYKLVDINYETDGGVYPIGCEITLLINDYNKSKFEGYMESRIASFNEDYLELYENIKYSYKETKLPDEAYDDESTENIVSLIYTITNGTSKDIEDTVYAISSITGFVKDDDKFTLNVISNTRSKEAFSNLYEEISTVSTFVDAKLSIDNTYDGYMGNMESPLYFGLNNINNYVHNKELKAYDTVRFTANSYLANKNSNLDILHIFVNYEDAHDMAKTINYYILKSNVKEESPI